MPPLDNGRALSMLFRGYSARRVAERLHTSNVTVSNLLKKFKKEAEEAESVLAAAANYGIEDQVDQLIKIGGVIEETKVDPSRAGLGLRIVKTAEDFGVDPEGVSEFIQAVNKEAKQQNLSPEKFVKVAKDLLELEMEEPRDYIALQKAFNDMTNQSVSLQNQISNYENRADAAKTQMEEAVKEKETTLEELNHYTALRGRLAPLGLDLRDIDKAESCLVNLSKQGNDSGAVVAFYSQGVELTEKVKKQESRYAYLSTEVLKTELKLRDANRELESKTELINRVREAEALGLRPSQLSAIVEATREAGARHGLDIKQSVNKLEKDLHENWEPKLGFWNDKTRLEAELDQLDEKVKLAQVKEEVTLERVRAHEESLRGLGELSRHVSAEEIIEFKRIIVDSGQNVPDFRGEIERLGSVTAAVNFAKNKKEADVAKLDKKAVELTAQVAQLEKVKAGLEATIETLNSEAVNAVRAASKTITDVAEKLRNDFEDPLLGYRVTIQRLGNDAITDTEKELEAKKEALKQSMDMVRSFIRVSLADVERLRKRTWDTAKVLGFSIHLTRLANIIGGEPVERVAALITMKMAVDAFIDYLYRNQLTNRCPSASRFSSELMEAMR